MTRQLSTVEVRKTILNMAYKANACHIGCAFSLVEILCVLYRKWIRYPNNNPRSEERDYLVLSKGHGVMASYACMYQLGWLSQETLNSYFCDGNPLKGLADTQTPGVEAIAGSLGHGLPVACGLALAAKRTKTKQRSACIVGDGELNEGSIWEAALFAAHQQLNNLIIIVDANGFQAMGETHAIMNLGVIEKKWESFGFEVATVDGHDEAKLNDVITALWSSSSLQPKAIIAQTVKGKGVSFMENDNNWHYLRLDKEKHQLALIEVCSPTI